MLIQRLYIYIEETLYSRNKVTVTRKSKLKIRHV